MPEGGTGPAPDDDASLRTRIGAVASRTRVRRRFLVDVGMLGLGVAAAGLYDGNVTRGGFPWAVLFVVLTFMNLKVRGLYDPRLRVNPLEDFSRIVSATSLAAILVVGARVAAGAVDGASLQGVRLWAWTTILLTAGRIGIAVVVRRRQRAGHGQMATLIVGADAIGRQIARRLAEQPELGLRPVGFIDEQLAPLEGRDDTEFPVLGTTGDVEAIVRRHDVRHLIVGYAAARPQLLTAAVRKCRRMGLQVSTVPRLYEDVNRRVDVEHIGGIPLLSSRPADPHSWQFSLKYGLDRLIAALLLILLAPVMAVDRARGQALVARLDPLPPAAREPRRARVLDAQVPHDARRRGQRRPAGRGVGVADRRRRPRGSTGCRERPAHAGRGVPAPLLARRAAAALQRAVRRHVAGRPAARAAPPTCSSSASTCTATATATA